MDLFTGGVDQQTDIGFKDFDRLLELTEVRFQYAFGPSGFIFLGVGVYRNDVAFERPQQHRKGQRGAAVREIQNDLEMTLVDDALVDSFQQAVRVELPAPRG